MKLLTTINFKTLFYLKFSNLTTVLFLLLTFSIMPLHANEQNVSTLLKFKNIPYNDIKTGSLYFKSPDGYFDALRQYSDYSVEVTGLLAHVSFSQTYKNNSDQHLEAVYVFPLIDDAAVDSMMMTIGERKIVGKIKEKQQAKKLYQQAKRKGKKASLVSQQRPNMFTTKVSNIAPGETVKITITYLQSVKYHQDEFSLRIPLTITPRYVPRSSVHNPPQEVTHKSSKAINMNSSGWPNISPPQTRSSNGQKVNINVKLTTGLALTNIESHYHKIDKHIKNNHIHISLVNPHTLLNQDFVLTWQVAKGSSPKAAFFQMADDSFNYGLLMVMPPSTAEGKVIDKSITYIIDISGSMGGVAIKQAKQALSAALDILNKDDSFNIIAFNDDAHELFSHNLAANDKNIAIAKRWLRGLTAGGGTNMYHAIAQALQKNQMNKNKETTEYDKYQQIIFITDGSVANEQILFTLIENNLGNTRLHTVGIGSAPNSYFMSRAAEFGRGTYRYVGSINEVSTQMHKLFKDISRPMMKNIKLGWPMDNVESYPSLIPDLYQQQPMIITTRWPKAVNTLKKSTITVEGQLGSSNWQEQINIPSNDIDYKSNKGIAQWWARQKIKELMQQHRQSDSHIKALLQKQITDLSIKHQLISAYTSFIAVEEKISRKASSTLTTKAIANLMPQGSTQIVPLANTALGVKGGFYIGVALLILSYLLQLFLSNHRTSNKNNA